MNSIPDRTAELAALHARIFGSDLEPPPRVRSQSQAPVDADDASLLARAQAARDGGKFRRLWAGDTSGYPSKSEADLALAAKLLFWTHDDRERADRLFRSSGLYRSKWDQRHDCDGRTYGQMTLDEASERRASPTPRRLPPLCRPAVTTTMPPLTRPAAVLVSR